MTGSTAAWAALAACGVTALGVDLALTLRRGRQSLRAALIGSLGWLVAGLAFAAVVRAALGAAHAGTYLTVFLLEKSLSLDNVAVFAVVLSAFAVAPAKRQRVLVGGILAALVLRLGFVAGGLAVVSAAHWVLVAFGVVLLVAGFRMAGERKSESAQPGVVRWLRRRGVSATLGALMALALTDLVFAVDSVPAAFAVTRDVFPIVAANVFAVLGLRPLYDLLAAAMDRLALLERALGVLLLLIGAALVVEPWWRVPEWVILLAVVATLSAGVLLSLVSPRRVVVAIGGGILLAAGAAMLVLPGPGLLVIAAGLALLATEFLWAKTALNHVKKRIPRRKRERVG
ncbi:MAG TPA: PGPGW domain-containing protein [Mycobacteriales bacterium]|nr:PGPGW domain-containing protein [Mycobacteriales bacterium]